MTNFDRFKKNTKNIYLQANEDWIFVNNYDISDMLDGFEDMFEHQLENISIVDNRYISIPIESMADFLYIESDELIEFLKESIPDFPN